MPQRNDHLRIITDAGASVDLGWDYGLPYSIDPLNGVDVGLQLAQGVNQIGQTVERQSVAGVYRELIVHCHSDHGDGDANLLLQILPYFTKGTLYFGDKYFCRFVVSKTPYTKSIHPYPVLDMMFFCPKPFWYDLTSQSFVLGGYTPSFRLPVNYAQPHCFGVRTSVGWLNARNPGALPVPFTAVLRCDMPVLNPRVENVVTGQVIRLLTTLEPDQLIEIYRTTTDKMAVRRIADETEENIFALLDDASTLTELAPGDNLLRADADSGADTLQVSVSFYPMVSGILPEVIA